MSLGRLCFRQRFGNIFFNVLEPYGFIYYSVFATGVNGSRNRIEKDAVANETRQGLTGTFALFLLLCFQASNKTMFNRQ